MGRRRIRWTAAARGVDPALVRCALLGILFLAGAAVGQACASGADTEGLRAYLSDYCAAAEEGLLFSLGGALVLYGGWCGAALLLGFASVGAVLIPLLSALYGFLTMYSVSCFAAAFGRWGVGLALGAMGVRLLFTLPCFFALAGAAWPAAMELAALSLGRGRRSAPVLYGRRYALLFLLCAVILTAGILCERFLTPVCFRLALEGAF